MSPSREYPTSLRALCTNFPSGPRSTHVTLRITTERNGSALILRAGGEVDAANEVMWRRVLSQAAAATSEPGPLVVDVNGLDFMGCCAYAALADEADRSHPRGIEVCLVSQRAITRRIIAAGALGSRLRVYPDVGTAVSIAHAHSA